MNRVFFGDGLNADSLEDEFWNLDIYQSTIIDKENLFSILRQSIPNAIGYSVRIEKREIECYVLRCKNGLGEGTKTSSITKVEDEGGFSSSYNENLIQGTRATFDNFISSLNDASTLFFVNETKLEGKYDYYLESSNFDGEELLKSLSDCGLSHKKEKRMIDCIVIEQY